MQQCVFHQCALLLTKPCTPIEDTQKMCISNKPAQYGLLTISMSDAEVPYTCFTLPYSGKRENRDQFYVSSKDEKTHYLVNNLSKHSNIRGRNTSMDRYFMSIPLSEQLFDKNIALVETLKENRVGTPAEIKDVK